MTNIFTCGTQYFNQSNVRSRIIIEAAIDIGREIAADDKQQKFVAELQKWWNTESYPGIGIDLDARFQTTEERRFWSQVFHTLAQRVYHRKWGNQDDQTWQVHFIASCHILSLMLCGLVWSSGDRGWFPLPTDGESPRPDVMRIQL